MNIVYLIGNGFDKNVGLKTSYYDFYEYYKRQACANDDIIKFKHLIGENPSELWSDLEFALGQVTTEFNDAERFVTVVKDISDNLQKYIKEEAERLQISPIATEQMRQYLSTPFDCLMPEIKRQAEAHFQGSQNQTWDINIISFNYTYTLEWILSDFVGKRIGSHHANNAVVNLKGIHHIHGTCDTSILLGVNDISQIANESFRNDEYLLEWLVKPRTQSCLSDGVERTCKRLISEANLICIFGMSFGTTDNLWWKCIQERLAASPSSRAIIYDFAKGITFTNNRAQDRGLYRRRAKQRLAMNRYSALQNSIYCDTNTGMFDLGGAVVRNDIPYDVQIAKVG